jgi:4-amino-4-deoxy-L-arabinose transferase-like glycosyltransferase
MSGLSPFPWIYPLWQSWTVALFGRTLFGFRAASAVIGTLNIAALYLLAKALFDRQTALLAAVLLTAFPPHLHFSRVGIIQISDPMFATFGFAFIGLGLKHNRLLYYTIGGVMIAFSQYFYEAGRLLFPSLMVMWLVGVIVFWGGGMVAHRRGLAKMLLAFALLTIPIYYTIFALGDPITGRLQESGLDNAYWRSVISGSGPFDLQNYLDHLTAPFLFYVSRPDTSIYYGGQTPLVLIYVVPFFLLGAVYALWRLRSPGMLLVVLWMLLASFGNSLLVGSAVSSRYLTVFPPMALLIAVGIRYGLPMLRPARVTIGVGYAVSGVLVAALAVGQVAYYFGPHLEYYQVQSRTGWDQKPIKDIHDAVLRSVNFRPGTWIHVITDPELDGNYGNEMLRFFADNLELVSTTPEQLTPEYFKRLKRQVDHAFFIAPEDTYTLNILKHYLILDPPEVSPYDMPPGTQLILYYAEYAKNPGILR